MEDALPGIIAENIRNVSNASHAITGAQQVLKDVTLIHATICSGYPGDVRSSDLESFRKKSGSCVFSKQNRTLCFSPLPQSLTHSDFKEQLEHSVPPMPTLPVQPC